MRNILSTAVAEHGSIWAIQHERLKSWGALEVGDVAPANRSRRGNSSAGSIALLPLYGILTQRNTGLLAALFGGTGTEAFGRLFDAMVADPDVSAIALTIDSPGGSVHGTPELAEKIFAARGKKQIVAVANSLAASAAYWIGTAADKFYVTPGGQAGSIGVYQVHQDFSEAEKKAGVRTTLIHAGRFKIEGSPFEPLGDEARDAIQEEVNQYYSMFVDAVARHRGVAPSKVRSGYGQGRVLSAKDAVAAGMADGIYTLESVIGRLARGGRYGGNSAAARRLNAAEAALLVGGAQ